MNITNHFANLFPGSLFFPLIFMDTGEEELESLRMKLSTNGHDVTTHNNIIII